MTMEYRLSLTPRLIALAIFTLLAMLILLFTLGYQIGQRMAVPSPAAVSFAPVTGAPGKDAGSIAAQKATQQATQAFNQQLSGAAAAATKSAAGLTKAAP